MTEATNLTGKFLIASPGMQDHRFAGSVILICAYGPEGAMGLIINLPAPDIDISKLMDQLGIAQSPRAKALPVLFGGPVEPGRGFVLHSPDYHAEGTTLVVNDIFSMTASLQILEALGEGTGPDDAILALGYAGWAPGQLENEIIENGWLIADAEPTLVFETSPGSIWAQALATIGISPSALSPMGGRA